MCRRYMKIFFINTRIELNTLKSVHFFIKHVEYKLIYSLRLRHASCMDGGGTKRKENHPDEGRLSAKNGGAGGPKPPQEEEEDGPRHV